MLLELEKCVQSDTIQDDLSALKSSLEERLNLQSYPKGVRPMNLTQNKLMRLCLLVGLSDGEERDVNSLPNFTFKRVLRFTPSFFTKDNMKPVFSALIKLRYKDIDSDSPATLSKVVNAEIMRGIRMLLTDGIQDEWLFSKGLTASGGIANGEIPMLDLVIGHYEDEMEAVLSVNSRNIQNSQILVAGSTGSGKSNLLAVLIQQMRHLSTDTSYPVNFLLFDYKGEFSDLSNASWLREFDTDVNCILRPMEEPMPFTPFKDFSKNPLQNEINLYSTGLATALCAIDQARISANMSNHLSEAIIEAYKQTNGAPISFDLILKKYQDTIPERFQDKDDSITSVLKQLIRNRLFSDNDSIDLLKNCYIIDLGKFQKDGPIAKAIVYFVVSKLNNIYETLPKQAVSDDCVEIRHFTIIDEAHYMLSFDNKPLRDLIAVGRNKGMSIILATQNMDSFKSPYFDFYANAQYPLLMKQQSINDQVLKDLFGVSGRELQELRSDLIGLQKGELLLKNPDAIVLGIGKKWKKIKVTHLI